MNTLNLTIDDALLTQLKALAAAWGQEVNQFATATLADVVKKEAARERGLAEGRALLEGPARSIAESNAALMAKFSLPYLSHLSEKELDAEADRIIAEMDPAVRSEMEREGLL